MTNKISIRWNELDKVPDFILNKNGWVALVLPIAAYGIYTLRDLSSEAMDKGYNIDFHFKEIGVSLTKAPNES